MDNKKRKQHYVFQAYLNAWTTDNKLWCIRDKKSIFNTGTINVVQERDFYRIKPLNSDEKRFYDLFMNRMNPKTQEAINEHMDAYLKPLEWEAHIKVLKSILVSKFGNYESIPDDIKDEFNRLENHVDVSINNIEEDYHSEIEGDGVKWINLLKNKDISFYENNKSDDKGYFDDDQFHFIYFLCVQYYRTKAMRERWIYNFKPCFNHPKWNTLNIPKERINLENLAHHFFWDFQNRVAYVLRKKNARLSLLVNETDIPFITSDQPVINICANYQCLSEETTDLVFYYPISPDIAITINSDNAEKVVKLNIEQIDEYNQKIVDASYQHVLANNSEVFERYIKI